MAMGKDKIELVENFGGRNKSKGRSQNNVARPLMDFHSLIRRGS
jgi:hypothetical protein